jgi:hypothetical protein
MAPDVKIIELELGRFGPNCVETSPPNVTFDWLK